MTTLDPRAILGAAIKEHPVFVWTVQCPTCGLLMSHPWKEVLELYQGEHWCNEELLDE